ncbi:cytochrome c oxidase assembly protein [Dictyobacter formicarum]|uniref:Membrane protein n=1 Tax=Dictyobacter formicarum TaxID=2778368 RepID=A0ABQ3VWA5_9CHLR|nr:cytochrome c oxidase assembly protein [Dictyobacter formicarum]GHO89576.1 membrane protein [Dictyobacter formicarum]
MRADVGLNFWLTQWNWQPSIILGTAIILGLYIYLVGPIREKYQLGEPVKSRQAVLFFAGVYCIFFALVSPLDELGDAYLFSAHMVQHLLLTIVAPPLMIVGTPGWLFQSLLNRRIIYKVGRFLTYPAVAFVIFNVNFWLWHAPALYDATLYDPNLHILEHITYIVTGVIYWWPVFSPLQEGWPRLSMGGQLLYIFLGGMPTVLLGAGLTFMDPLYEPYIHAPRAWGLSPATDQQLGGLIMWIPANIAYIIVASVFFIRWMQAQDEKQRMEEERRYAAEIEEELFEEEHDASAHA